jgi:hypothetical protein
MMQELIATMSDHNAQYPVDKNDGVTPLKPILPGKNN